MIMAVEAPKKPVIDRFDSDDDDDGPIIFKRAGGSTGKQSNSDAGLKKSSLSSQNGNGQSSRGKTALPSSRPSTVKSPIGSANASSVKSPIRSANASSVKSPIISPKGSTLSSKMSPKMSPVTKSKASALDGQYKQVPKQNVLTNSKASASLDGQYKQVLKQNVLTNSKASASLDGQHRQVPKQNALSVGRENSGSVKKEMDSNDDEDSEDDMPLSVRLKGNSNGAKKGSPIKEENSDAEDRKPISSQFGNRSSEGTSGSKPSNSIQRKPLVVKSEQNGSITKDNQQKPSLAPVKRPMDKPSTSQQSLPKKPKIEVTQASVKLESKTDDDDDDDEIPIAQRIKMSGLSTSKSSSSNQKSSKVTSNSFNKTNKNKKQMKNSKYSKSSSVQPGSTDGQKKWTTLVHSGVIFPPPYQLHGIKILYKGRPVDLTPEQEEVATMFAVMKETDYMQKPKFLENFWNDWRKLLGKNHVIQKLEDCDFTPIYDWYQQEKEKKKQMSSEEKKVMKEEKLKQEEKFMWAVVDGVKEKVGNFRVEPPGLFRGRGEHPKMGKLKRRILPSDITINIGKDAPVPECPIPGQSWKEVKHDNTVTWLAFWNDPINPKEFKYVFLAASSSLKGQSDKEKYEKARKLKDYIHNIREAYTKNFTSKDISKRQSAVATYLIDKLALRAGNEKDDDEADTVGCCTLKVANVECVPPNQLKFDFLGKDSVRYVNTVEVELPVYKAIGQFQHGKKQTDDLFDQLDTSKLNVHLKELMPGLTAKVFRTYNASITLDDQLYRGTDDGLDVAEKIVVYNQANKQVAIICNHQRTVSKNHGAQMTKLTEKIEELKDTLKELQTDLDRARKGKPPLSSSDGKRKRNLAPEAIEKKIASTNQRIEKMELAMKTKEDLKTVALGTSKINYLDPRITVAWCKRHEVPIEKIFNKSLLAKFAWAMDVDPQFRF